MSGRLWCLTYDFATMENAKGREEEQENSDDDDEVGEGSVEREKKSEL